MNTNESIVVTGVNGFVGEHLARHLKGLDFSVIGIGREDEVNKRVSPYIDTYYCVDMFNREEFAGADMKSARAVIHLAGLASVADSFKNPDLYRTGNAQITDNLLSTLQEQAFSGRVVLISTGALYDPNQELPLSESSQLINNSPYADGKIRAEEVIRTYVANGLDAVIVRPFNHIGPGQGQGFLVPDLYQQLLEAKDQNKDTISTGNIDTRRDYTDVRDIVRAYTLLALADSLSYGLYNVASGKSLSGREILESIQREMRLTHIEPVVDESRIRPGDPLELVGDASRLSAELGWSPELSIDDTIRDFINDKHDRA